MSKLTRENLGGFLSEEDFPDGSLPDATPMPDAAISIAELQAKGVPFEWYEAVAVTQGLCAALSASVKKAPARIGADTVYLNADGTVSALTVGRSTGETLLQQVTDLLRDLLTDKNIPTPLRLALSTSSVNDSLDEWSKMVVYYERPNRSEIIKEVYERAVTLSSTAAAYRPKVVAIAIPEKPPVPAPVAAVVPAPRRPQLPALTSRQLAAASAVVGIPLIIVALAWAVPRLGSALRSPATSASSASAAAPLETAASGADAANATTGPLILKPALPPKNSRVLPAAGVQASARPGTTGLLMGVLQQPSGVASGGSGPSAAMPIDAGGSPRPDDLEAAAALDTERIYSREDADVVPPLAVYPRFPSALPPGLSAKDIAEFYVVVSETGSVDSVRARRVPETMAEAMTVTMSLSAAKTWHFRPGMKNGRPVKYRTIVWVAKN